MSVASGEREERFTKLYDATYGAIHAYAARRLGAEAADEIAAETFLVAWRRLEDLPESALPWLYGVARNMVARTRSTSGRRSQTEAALAHELAPADADLADAGDIALWEAWEQLRAADQEVLALVAWEELTVSDAARVLGCPARVFSVRLHRARHRLERLLTQSDPHRARTTELSEA